MRDFDRIVAEAARHKEQAKAHEETAKALLDSLGELAIDDYVAGNFILRVSPNRRFEAATAKRNLTPEEFEAILKLTPDSALAKAVLDPETYRLCQREYEPKRTIVRVEDI